MDAPLTYIFSLRPNVALKGHIVVVKYLLYESFYPIKNWCISKKHLDTCLIFGADFLLFLPPFLTLLSLNPPWSNLLSPPLGRTSTLTGGDHGMRFALHALLLQNITLKVKQQPMV